MESLLWNHHRNSMGLKISSKVDSCSSREATVPLCKKTSRLKSTGLPSYQTKPLAFPQFKKTSLHSRYASLLTRRLFEFYERGALCGENGRHIERGYRHILAPIRPRCARHLKYRTTHGLEFDHRGWRDRG